MKKFRFPLERLLEVRHHRMLAAQAELHASVVRQREAEERVAAVESEIQDAVDDVRDRLLESPTATEVLTADTILRGMHAALESESTLLAQAAATVAEARGVVEARRQETEIVERLKDRALATHRLEAAREQERATDEMVAERARRTIA